MRRVLRDRKTGDIAVEVAFGTSNLKLDRHLPHQLIVSHRNDLREAGLAVPTRFDLTLVKILPWAGEFFAPPRSGAGAIIGRLSAVNRLDLIELQKDLRIGSNRLPPARDLI